MKNEISLQKISGRISLGMLLSILVMGSAWSAEVTSEPTATVKGRVPVMTTGEIQSNMPVIGIGAVLSMKAENDKWTFSDADNDLENGTLYVWKTGNVELSSGKETIHKSYTITANDLGKSITLHVTPMTDPLQTDPSTGETVVSNPLSTINANTVTKVTIAGYKGNPLVDGTLTTTLTCSGTNGGGCAAVTDYNYQWQIEGRDANTGDGNTIYTNIPNATLSSYTPTKDQQKLKLKVKVQNNTTKTNTTAETAETAETAKTAKTSKAKAAKVTQ